MTTKYPCYLQFSDSGNYAKLVHRSGFIIAEFLIDSSDFVNRAAAAHDRLGLIPLADKFRKPESIFVGEVNKVYGREIIIEEIQILNQLVMNFRKINAQMNEEKAVEIANKVMNEKE